MFRALFGGQVYAVDCRIDAGNLHCKGLYVDVPSLLGCTVKLKDIDNDAFWIEVKLPLTIEENIQKEDHILEIVDYERVPF
jgi:hypothetical protein